MANPPITVGPWTNVPAPGSPIKSDWPQTISNYLWGRYPRGWIGAGLGGTINGVAATDTDVPNMAVGPWSYVSGRKYLVICQWHITKNGGAGNVVLTLANSANTVLASVTHSIPAGVQYASPTLWHLVDGAGAAVTVKGRVRTDTGTVDIRTGNIALVDLGTTVPIQ